jgi:hypothetical protein
MKAKNTCRRGLRGLYALYFRAPAFISMGLLFFGLGTAISRAQVLLSAPSANSAYYGMAGPFLTAAQFTLANSFYISTINVSVRTTSGTAYNVFDFTVQDSLASNADIFASQSLTAAVGGQSTLTLTVDADLAAGTYYLTSYLPGYFGSPGLQNGNVNGWVLSTGSYNQADGTIFNGVWANTDPPSDDSGGVYVAPAFTVNGTPVPVPEPSALALGLVGLDGAWLRFLRRPYLLRK